MLWTQAKVRDMEKSPKLTTDQLPKNRRVPRDTLLRGASAEEVVGSVRAWLANERPNHKSVTITLAANEAAIGRVERRWQRLCRTNGIPENRALIGRTDRATTFFSEIVLLPDTVADLATFDVLHRARGVSTLAHEWWHACRRSEVTKRSFEEGTADAFAKRALWTAFGINSPWQAYPDLFQAVTLIGQSLELENWYLPSREAIHLPVWLRQTLENAGYDSQAINEVLLYNIRDSDWSVRVKRMVLTR
jgi:hypothetical protein